MNNTIVKHGNDFSVVDSEESYFAGEVDILAPKTNKLELVPLEENNMKNVPPKIEFKVHKPTRTHNHGENLIERSERRLRNTTNAVVWAQEFIKTARRNQWTIDDIDEDLMLGWFANAICTAIDHVEREYKDK